MDGKNSNYWKLLIFDMTDDELKQFLETFGKFIELLDKFMSQFLDESKTVQTSYLLMRLGTIEEKVSEHEKRINKAGKAYKELKDKCHARGNAG